MARLLNKDPETYLQEQQAFARELQQFHDNRNTPFRKIPRVNGKDIDLYLLYVLITAHGGWEKVNTSDDWELILEYFHLPRSCLNASVGLKHVYLRYLDAYEKIHFFGEDVDKQDEDEEGRKTKKTARVLHSVPLTYNHNQHKVSDALRTTLGMSNPMARNMNYERLLLSLLSPLPNEQDFAINVCTLLSNEGKHTLKLQQCPRLVEVLVAHAGVYEHAALRDIVGVNYIQARERNLCEFWTHTVLQEDMRRLCDENWEDIIPTSANAILLMQNDDELFLNLGRDCGVRDWVGQRILQVASVIRNLSFEDDNAILLAKSVTLLRFLMLCCASEWGNLRQLGLDTLANIASEVSLEVCVPSLTSPLINILTKGLLSCDRGYLIACLNVLQRLAQVTQNEDVLCEGLSQEVFEKICNLLSLQDILLLVSTLECLHALSLMGEDSCNRILHCHGTVSTLVSLTSVEAQSYGPKACILMRVVETVASGTLPQQQTPPQPQVTPAIKVVPPSINDQPEPLKPSLVTQSSISPKPRPSPSPSPLQRSTPSPLPITIANLPPPNARDSEGEPFALSWLKQSLEYQMNSDGMEQGELHRRYLAACTKGGARPLSLDSFTSCIRRLFGVAVGPMKKGIYNMLQGLVVRGGGKLVPITSSQVTLPAKCPSSPILKAQLSAPPKTPETAKKIPSPSPPPADSLVSLSTPPPSALIRSLLASKVPSDATERPACMRVETRPVNQILGMRPSVVQVAQRQRIQQQQQQQQQASSEVSSRINGAHSIIEYQPSATITQQIPNLLTSDDNSNPPSVDTISTTASSDIDDNSLSSFDSLLHNGGVLPSEKSKTQCLLADLLERKGAPPPNGLLSTRDIRISEKGLELIERNHMETSDNMTLGLKRKNVEDVSVMMPQKKVKIEVKTVPFTLSPQQPLVNGGVQTITTPNITTSVSIPAAIKPHSVIVTQSSQPQSVIVTQPTQTHSIIVTHTTHPSTMTSTTATTQQVILPRQLVMSPGQIVVPRGQVVIQGIQQMQPGVIVSHASPMLVTTPGTDGGPPKTILILPAPSGNLTNQQVVMQVSRSATSSISLANGVPVASGTPLQLQIQVPTSQQSQTTSQQVFIATTKFNSDIATIGQTTSVITTTPVPSIKQHLSTPVTSVKVTPRVIPSKTLAYLCEWRGCMRSFANAEGVYMHACQCHCPESLEEGPCLWERCDGMQRRRFSLMTHLFDKHCNPEVLKAMSLRRRQLNQGGQSDIPPPTPSSPHPGYAPNAAWQAIKRHALQQQQKKEALDDTEGPVTKSIRLTAALILRNLVLYSAIGRRQLRRYESQLSTVALSGQEASRTVAQLLYDLSDDPR